MYAVPGIPELPQSNPSALVVYYSEKHQNDLLLVTLDLYYNIGPQWEKHWTV